jgi:hypothetical protein
VSAAQNADPITVKICQQVCDVVMAENSGESKLIRKIRVACMRHETEPDKNEHPSRRWQTRA